MSGEKQHEVYGRRKSRNLIVGGALGLLVVLVFTITIIKLGENATSPFVEQFEPALKYRETSPPATSQ